LNQLIILEQTVHPLCLEPELHIILVLRVQINFDLTELDKIIKDADTLYGPTEYIVFGPPYSVYHLKLGKIFAISG
jgi:hypothetical protein